MALKCQCCGFEADLSPEDAFQQGWDAPPHFHYVCCPLCPGVCIVLGASHAKAHALWAKEGRPADFSLEKCATDDAFGRPEALARVQSGMDAVERALKELKDGK